MKVSKEFKIGLASIIVIGCLFWGFNFLKKKKVFVSQNKFYAIYKDVGGLVDADALIINGYKVGFVSSIQLSDDSSKSVTVTMLVDNKIKVPKNSVARIISSDIMGSKVIQLVLGTSEKYAGNGDTLLAEREETFQQSVDRAIEPLQKKADSLLSSVDSVISKANTAKEVTRGIIYKVQIFLSDKKIPLDAPRFKGIEDMGMYIDKAGYKYTAGEYTTMQDAIELKEILRNKAFKDAFVIATKDGERIPLK